MSNAADACQIHTFSLHSEFTGETHIPPELKILELQCRESIIYELGLLYVQSNECNINANLELLCEIYGTISYSRPTTIRQSKMGSCPH